jgi:hypothetical protein
VANEYPHALEEFEAARRIKESPELDYNIARCHDRLEHYREAVTFYERFLEARPGSPDAPELRQRVSVLRQRLERELPAPPPEPVAPPPVTAPPPHAAAPPAAPAPTVTPPSVAPAPVATPPPSPPRRTSRRTTIAVAVSVTAVVLTAAALGLAFGLQPSQTNIPFDLRAQATK